MLTSRDPITQHVTTVEIQREQALQRPQFQPMQFTRDVMAEEPGISRRALVNRSKAKVREEDTTKRCEHAESLPRQGQLMRMTEAGTTEVWSDAVNSFSIREPQVCSQCCIRHPSPQLQLGAMATERGPQQWLRQPPTSWPISQEPHTNTHSTSAQPTSGQISSSGRRTPKQATLLELTVFFETTFEEAAQRKMLKYLDLREEAQSRGYKAELMTIEVGSRGVVSTQGFKYLHNMLGTASKKEFKHFLIKVARTAIMESHKICCTRNWRN